MKRMRVFVFAVLAAGLFCGAVFGAAPTYTISGVVETAGGIGVEGVSVSGDNGGGSAVTASDGSYSIVVSKRWSGVVSVSKSGWVITPSSRSYSLVTADKPNEDYSAFQPKISGVVKDADGNGLSGVAVSANNSGGSGVTDANGNYEIYVDYGWSGTVSASLSGYYFADQNYTNVEADQTGQDFSGFQPTISGYVKTADGSPLEGAVLYASNLGAVGVSDANGYYEFYLPYGWDGSFLPNLSGYAFVSKSLTNVIADVNEQNFSGYQPKIYGSTQIAGALVTISGVGSVVSTPDYSLTVPHHWKGTITVTLSGYDFPKSPWTYPYTGIVQDTMVNFNAFQPTISGYVKNRDGTPVGSATVIAGDNESSCITDSNGYYEITVPYEWTGNVTVKKYDVPLPFISDRSYSDLTGDLSNQDFVMNYSGVYSVKSDGTGDAPTIQSAIDFAIEGDVIELQAGRYTGDGNRDVTYNGKAVTVRGATGDPNDVIIDCQGGPNAQQHRGFSFVSGESSDSVLESLTITNGYAYRGYYNYPFMGYVSLGGGISCMYKSSPSIINCVVTGNHANDYGGGIFIYDSNPNIQDCIISNNSSGLGGGIKCYRSTSDINRCIITNNTASGGGGVSVFDGVPTLRNCIIHNNSAGSGGAITNNRSKLYIYNCTIYGNTADIAGGIRNVDTIGGTSSTHLRSCIVRANTESQLYGDWFDVWYSNIQDGATQSNYNIDEDPLFEGDGFELSSESPCINSGDADYIMSENDVDIYGNLRLVGTRIDMGAVEFLSSEAFIHIPEHEIKFYAFEARNNPSQQTLSFNNLSLTNNLNWTVSSNDSWLSVSPGSGGINHQQTATIGINVDVNDLQGGDYTGTFTITDPDASNSPKVVSVNLKVTGESLQISQSDYSFTASKETINPSAEILTISNSIDAGTLAWSITADCDWMTIEPALGTIASGSADVLLDIDQTKIEYGSHTCQLTVDAPGATNSPQVVTVSLEVLRPAISLSGGMFNFECDVDEPNVIEHVISISNSGYDVLEWSISEECDWLTVSPVSGECVAGPNQLDPLSLPAEPNEVVLTIDTAGLGVGYYDCVLTIRDENASNSPFNVPVRLHVYRDGERHVPLEYPKISEAVKAAVDGDHVIIHPGFYGGLYNNRISSNNKNIVIRSVDPEDRGVVEKTIISGAGMQNIYGIFLSGSDESKSARVEGLVFDGFMSQAIHCVGRNRVIRNCIFRNSSPMYNASVIRLGDSSAVIENCEFVNSFLRLAKYQGAVIQIENNNSPDGHVVMRNCLVGVSYRDDYYSNSRSSGVYVIGGNLDILNCTIAYNYRKLDNDVPYTSTSAGILVNQANVTIDNSIIWGNESDDGSQIGIIVRDPHLNPEFEDARVSISNSNIEGGLESVIIFPDLEMFNYYTLGGQPVDPNLVDPNVLTWGEGNIDVDPLFVRVPDDGGDGWALVIDGTGVDQRANNDYGDLHLKSSAGRFLWDGYSRADFNFDRRVDLADLAIMAEVWGVTSQSLSHPCNINGDYSVNYRDLVLFIEDYLQESSFGEWVVDDVTSPCIDAGKADDEGWKGELWPHGGRVNMGAFGGTAQASMSLDAVGNAADLNHDGVVNIGDWGLFAYDWMEERILMDSDLDRDNDVDLDDLAIFLSSWLE